MRVLLITLFTAFTGLAYGQNLHQISLKAFALDTTGIHFKISEVIDARRDKNIVGIIQRGLSNRKDLAVFEKPRLKEVEDILIRSGLSSDNGYVMRITNLNISELTRAAKETARAELSVDFFIRESAGLYKYLASANVTAESSGIEVTAKHPSNIVNVLQQILVKFENLSHTTHDVETLEPDQLADSRLTFKSADPEILFASKYIDGFYASFDDFLNNNPSIPADCKVNFGKKIKVKCGESEGQIELYGFAKDNVLYVFFHGEFFSLKKDEDGFYFVGPKQFGQGSMESMSNAWLTAGALGYFMTGASKNGYNETYRLDLSTGGIKSRAGF